MKALSPFFKVKKYILTDSNGEWWMSINKSGELDYYCRQDKEFKTLELAKTCGRSLKGRFRVEYLTPPVENSITWGHTIVFDSDFH